MGRADEVKFTCDEPGCTGNASFKEGKAPGYAPDGWELTYVQNQDGEETLHYKCPKHN